MQLNVERVLLCVGTNALVHVAVGNLGERQFPCTLTLCFGLFIRYECSKKIYKVEVK